MKYFILAILVFALLSSCKVQKIKKYTSNFSKSTNHHFGYLFIDSNTDEILIKGHADKYFVPASTTKLFTLYTSLTLLSDSIPALSYAESGDSLVFWGTGDPSFLRSDYPENNTLEFLKSKADKALVFSDANFYEHSHGKGWMWDDNLEGYQAEVSPLPLYGNLARFDSTGIMPSYFEKETIEIDSFLGVKRKQNENQFTIGKNLPRQGENVPYITSGPVTASLLADTLNIPVHYESFPYLSTANTIYSVNRDSLLIPMMSISDNMLAEQLMLLSSGQLSDTLSINMAIDYMLNNRLQFLPQKPRWVDGSGLSRYNLISPHDLVALLQQMKGEYGLEKTQRFLPTNGQSGTLRNFNKDEDKFIYAKSGSMSGVYNLAGFLKTKSGRTLTFAIMNNNATQSVSTIRLAMSDFLLRIRDNY